MASLEMPATGRNASGRRKKSIRVDFTPLVDLGFLLITFFMLTTSMLRPNTMEVQKPKGDIDQMPIKNSQAMTLFLTKMDKIVYYFGMPKSDGIPFNAQITDFSKLGIRKILKLANKLRNPLVDSIQIYKNWARQNKISEQDYIYHRAKIESDYSDRALIVLIKAEDQSRYNNMVDILDEMSIANIRSYALMDISPKEAQFVNSLVK